MLNVKPHVECAVLFAIEGSPSSQDRQDEVAGLTDSWARDSWTQSQLGTVTAGLRDSWHY